MHGDSSIAGVPVTEGHFAPRALLSRPLALRSAMLLGAVASAWVASSFASPLAPAGVEPALVKLLRGMALIKALIAMTALGLAFWRFGRPISLQTAVACVAGVWSLVVATVLIWSLNDILIAAGIFHLALFALLVIAWRDGLPQRTSLRLELGKSCP